MTKGYLSEVKDMEEFARFLHFCLKGIEMPFINGIISKNNDEKFVETFTKKIILSALEHTGKQ